MDFKRTQNLLFCTLGAVMIYKFLEKNPFLKNIIIGKITPAPEVNSYDDCEEQENIRNKDEQQIYRDKYGPWDEQKSGN